MALWVKCSSHKYKELSLERQHSDTHTRQAQQGECSTHTHTRQAQQGECSTQTHTQGRHSRVSAATEQGWGRVVETGRSLGPIGMLA